MWMGGCQGESVCVCGGSWAGPALFKIALGETRVMGEGGRGGSQGPRPDQLASAHFASAWVEPEW